MCVCLLRGCVCFGLSKYFVICLDNVCVVSCMFSIKPCHCKLMSETLFVPVLLECCLFCFNCLHDCLVIDNVFVYGCPNYVVLNVLNLCISGCSK